MRPFGVRGVIGRRTFCGERQIAADARVLLMLRVARGHQHVERVDPAGHEQADEGAVVLAREPPAR